MAMGYKSLALGKNIYGLGGKNMWIYDKKLEYPVKIKCVNPKTAQLIITQYGGPDGELAAALRYLSQRFSMPTGETKAILNDIGTEELAHLEIIGSMVHQLTKGVSGQEASKTPYANYYADHDNAVYPVSAAGNPFTAAYLQSKGDILADLYEDLAADGTIAQGQQTTRTSHLLKV